MRKPTQKNIFSLFSNIFWILVTHISLPTSHIDERCANGISGSGHTRQSSSYKASGLERKGIATTPPTGTHAPESPNCRAAWFVSALNSRFGVCRPASTSPRLWAPDGQFRLLHVCSVHMPARDTAAEQRLPSQNAHARSVLDRLFNGQALVVTRKLIVLGQEQPAAKSSSSSGGGGIPNAAKEITHEPIITARGLEEARDRAGAGGGWGFGGGGAGLTCSGIRGARASARMGSSSSHPSPRPACPHSGGTGRAGLRA